MTTVITVTPLRWPKTPTWTLRVTVRSSEASARLYAALIDLGVESMTVKRVEMGAYQWEVTCPAHLAEQVQDAMREAVEGL